MTSNSYHIFSFPFKWDFTGINSKKDDFSFGERTNLSAFHESLHENWKEEYGSFTKEEWSRYSETVYFHPFARKGIFSPMVEKSFVKRFEYTFSKNPIYIIKHINNNAEYKLDIVKVGLAIFETGIGILSFFLENNDDSQKNIEAVFTINHLGRRIYPTYIDKETGIEGVKKTELPDYISIKGLFPEELKYDFTDYSADRLILPNFISRLLPSKELAIQPILDDRMFTACVLRDSAFAEEITKINEEGNEYAYHNSEKWLQYTFVDAYNFNTCQDNILQKELLKKHTYNRWTNYNTLYGFTRYSFMVVCKQDSPTYLIDHLQGMYHQMVVLILAQRASILRFSEEIANIPQKENNNINTRNIQELYLEYMDFKNKLYFREVTVQEQGIEMYDKLMDVSNIHKDIEMLDKEMTDLYNYANLVEQESSSHSINQLTIMGGLFLLPSFALSWLGLKVLEEEKISTDWKYVICSLVFFIIATVMLFWHLQTKSKKSWKLVVMIVLTVFGVFIPFFIKLFAGS